MKLKLKFGQSGEFEIESDDQQLIEREMRRFVSIVNQIRRPPRIIYVRREREVVVHEPTAKGYNRCRYGGRE